MGDAWKALLDAGVPDGAARTPGGCTPTDSLRPVLAKVLGDPALRVEPLLAWLSAFHHHWPLRFLATLGEEGERALVFLRDRPMDRNRYLKLRRIAVENLAASFH